MEKKDLNDGDLKNLSGGGADLEKPTPPPTDEPESAHGGNLMQNTEQDHDADGR